jgi:hypothetical protein
MSEEVQDTAPEQHKVPGKPFIKGDKRINRRGRPKSFDALRKLAIKIAGETIPNPQGEDYTRIEAMLRVLTSSKAPADRALFLAYAYGKPKDEVDITTGGEKLTEITIKYDTNNDNPTETPPSTAPGQTDPEKV